MPTTVTLTERKNDFPKIAAALREHAPAVAAATATRIAARARARAPVRTGRLERSIVSRGGYAFTSVPYARYQEFGTRKMRAHPFFVEAIREEAPFLRQSLRQLLTLHAGPPAPGIGL